MESVKHFIRGTMMSTRSLIQSPPKPEDIAKKLSAVSVPVTLDSCRSCANPCEGGDDFPHEEWGTKFFDVDLSSDLLGTVKPYGRQIIISTGKMDWQKEVTEAENSLAYLIWEAKTKLSAPAPTSPPETNSESKATPDTPPKDAVSGLFSSTDSKRIAILNGSHRTTCHDGKKQTVLVFPDYKMITEVEETKEDAELVWKTALNPELGRAGSFPTGMGTKTKSWPLPYDAVVLLCSHKRRDNRCAIAAPVLMRTLTASLESVGWEVHNQVEDPDHFDEPPIEDIPGSAEEREKAVFDRLKDISADDGSHKKALIIYISHMGGHKYAGNVIIYLPQGAGVWYGRVSSHEVAAVTKTITEGKVYPALLRGGINLSRPHGRSLMDW